MASKLLGDITLSNGMQLNAWNCAHGVSCLYFIHPKGQDECAYILNICRECRQTDLYEIIQQEPITIGPSINCPHCGLKGVIFDGKWEPNND